MKENKEYRQNANYFLRSETMKFVGIGLFALAIVLFFFGWGYLSYVAMSISFCAGLTLLLLSTFSRSSEADIDVYIEKNMRGVEAKPQNEKVFSRRQLKQIPVFASEGYEFSEGLMLKKGKDSSVRSSKYTKTVIYPLDTALLVCYRTVSLISDEVNDKSLEIPYSDITSFRTNHEEMRLSFGKGSFDIKKNTLVIESKISSPISLPVQESTKIDELVEKINALIASARKAKED